MIGTRRSPRQLLEGEGTIEAVGHLARDLGHRALLVSDPIIAEQPGFETIIAALEASGLEVERFVDAVSDVPL
jgi:alcohol dehydrogenase